MRKTYVALLLGVVVALAAALPASGDRVDRVINRITRLSDRVSDLTASQARERTLVRRITVRSEDDGSAEGTADCPEGTHVTGGGAEWAGGETDPFDRIRSSIPDGNSWYVQADSNRGAGAILTIYAVCARLGSE